MMKVSELWKHFSIFESYNTQIKSVSFDTYQLAEKRPFRSSLIFLKKYTILFNSICQNLENIKKCSRQFDEILTTFQSTFLDLPSSQTEILKFSLKISTE